MDLRTAGERLCRRELEKENRAGVPHFRPGQHYAEVIDSDPFLTVLLTWVDQYGHAVALPCKKLGDEWSPFPMGRKAGQSTMYGVTPVAPGYEFSAEQLEALNAAEERASND